MTKFVVRSMTTTDYRPQYGQLPSPYHVYLLKPERRIGAYWCASQHDVQLFDTVEAAQAEIDRCLKRHFSYEPLYDIVPQDDRAVPTFWDARKGESRKRVINTDIVTEQQTLSPHEVMAELFAQSFDRR